MVIPYFNNIRQTILQSLDEATEEIFVAVYWFTNHKLFDKLCEKVRQGKKVSLIIHNDYINNREAGLNFQSFIDLGGQFYFSDAENPMHNKFCIIDSKTLINGSYNWTYYAENRNSENILVIKDELQTAVAFHAEFLKLTEQLQQVDTVKRLTKFELEEFNGLDTREYLANDIIYEAKTTGDLSIVDSAFQISPLNIKVQQKAVALDLTKKRKVKHTIGSSLVDNKYLRIVEKGTQIPITITTIVQTVEDNQRSSGATIYYGENTAANRNIEITSLTLNGIPPKRAGEAKIKYIFTIDIYGKLSISKYSLDNGKRISSWEDITKILEDA